METLTPMAEFTLDTSGAVALPPFPESVCRVTRWNMLAPFTQGYVEAALKAASLLAVKGFDPCEDEDTGVGAVPRLVAFSDLAPETLALILRDCEAFQALGHWVVFNFATGRDFWLDRQGRQLTRIASRRFPPVTLYLGDDGKVYLREAA